MTVLLDTCGLLALAGNVGRLPKRASEAVAGASRVLVSPVSAWEIALKVGSGKLRIRVPIIDWYRQSIEHYQLQELALSAEWLCQSAALPTIHRDPFDRVLIAASLQHQVAIITSDRVIPQYPGVSTIW